MHILSLVNICIGHTYMYIMLIYLFTCILNAAYMQIGANKCKCLLGHTSVNYQVPTSLKIGKKRTNWFILVFCIEVNYFLLIIILLVLLVKLMMRI